MVYILGLKLFSFEHFIIEIREKAMYMFGKYQKKLFVDVTYSKATFNLHFFFVLRNQSYNPNNEVFAQQKLFTKIWILKLKSI